VTLLVEQDEISDVVHVRFFYLATGMPEASSLADAIKELGWLWCFHSSSCGKSPVVGSVMPQVQGNAHNTELRPQLLDNTHPGKVILNLRRDNT